MYVPLNRFTASFAVLLLAVSAVSTDVRLADVADVLDEVPMVTAFRARRGGRRGGDEADRLAVSDCTEAPRLGRVAAAATNPWPWGSTTEEEHH